MALKDEVASEPPVGGQGHQGCAALSLSWVPETVPSPVASTACFLDNWCWKMEKDLCARPERGLLSGGDRCHGLGALRPPGATLRGPRSVCSITKWGTEGPSYSVLMCGWVRCVACRLQCGCRAQGG